MTKQQPQIGFTLIEVMVALVIIATALAATVKVVGNATSNASYLVDTSFAQWVALNELEKIKIEGKWIGAGESSGSTKMADRNWYWQRKVKTTPDKDVNRIEMSVSNNKDDSSLVTVTGFISKPTVAARQTP